MSNINFDNIVPASVAGIIYHDGDFYSESKKSPGIWEKRDLEWVKQELMDRGFSPHVKDMFLRSQVQLAIQEVKNFHSVAYVGVVAGYKSGIHRIGDDEILIVKGPTLLIPQDIPFPAIDEVLDAVFEPEERMFFEYWLKSSIETLYAGPIDGVFIKGQVRRFCNK